MSRGLLKKAKALRKKQNAKRKVNKKNSAGILIFILIVIAIAAYLLVPGYLEKRSGGHFEAETYSNGNQIIQLNENGTFSANLAHNVKKSGTYTRATEDNRTIVIFTVNGKQGIGRIENNSLHLPKEWDDDHGHGSVFSKEK